MARKTCDLGNTQKFLHTGKTGATITAWAALDAPNNRALSHIEIYFNNNGSHGSMKIDMTCEELENFAGDVMRIMAYRRKLEAHILPACDQCQTDRESPEDANCLYCGKPFPVQVVATFRICEKCGEVDDFGSQDKCTACGSHYPTQAAADENDNPATPA